MNKEYIKYGLIALGAYLVWRYIEDHGGLSNVLGGTTTATAAPPPTIQTQQLTPEQIKAFTDKQIAEANKTLGTAPGSTSTAQTTLQKVAAAAGGANVQLNVDQWCWYYAHVAGIPCPDPNTFYHGDRSTPIDINTWWAAMTAAGMSGLSNAWSKPNVSVTPSWLM